MQLRPLRTLLIQYPAGLDVSVRRMARVGTVRALSHGTNLPHLFATTVVAACQSSTMPYAIHLVHGDAVAPHMAGAGIAQITAEQDV